MDEFISRVETIKDNNIIVEEGTWAYYAYILKSGRAKVWKTINGKQVLIGTLKEGDIFGEMSFFGMAKRTASVTADGDVTVEMITKDTFTEAINKLPKEVRAKLEKMSHDLFYLNDVHCRLTNCLYEISSIKEKIIDPKILENEIKNMPGFLQNIIALMGKRLHSAVEGSAEIMSRLEKTSKSIDSLSLSLVK